MAAAVAAAPGLGESLAGRQVFPATNWWNLDVSRAPGRFAIAAADCLDQRPHDGRLDCRPAAPSRLRSAAVRHSLRRRRGHPASRALTFVDYGRRERCRRARSARIPDSRLRRGRDPHYIEGDVPGGGTSGDRHMLIIDRDRWLLYESCSRRRGTRRRRAGKRARARCSIWRRTGGGRKDGRRRMRPGSRSFRASCATTKSAGSTRSATPSASRRAPRTVTCGRRRTRAGIEQRRAADGRAAAPEGRQ